MMTVMTTMHLDPRTANEWDQLIRARFRSAHEREGWISGQLLAPTDSPGTRVIVGIWRNRGDWEAWHTDPSFIETRQRLDDLQQSEHESVWHEVIENVQRD